MTGCLLWMQIHFNEAEIQRETDSTEIREKREFPVPTGERNSRLPGGAGVKRERERATDIRSSVWRVL